MPFISQIAGVPLSFCHRMSALPSKLKSPVPSTCQLGPGLDAPTGDVVAHAVNERLDRNGRLIA